ncbi:MAG TPA: LptF/LptG family permease [Candidatus Acidoferrales bacterium]|jgi:LPS export ABC transporter permease LptG/LPS export ABC transporter permease LptF|nr:LptF/LptG family permease [Candidatus Acidoferrales bacterium]
MRLIDRYVFRVVFSHALLGVLIFTFILFVPQLVTLMEFVVRGSGSAGKLGMLFLCTLPGLLIFTLPMGVLVGVLIGLGRLSADSELIAMSALGLGVRRVLIPMGVFAALTCAVGLGISLWLGPLTQRTLHSLEDEMLASQASFQVQPRVFNESASKLVLYVENVSATGTNWRGVFLAGATRDKSSELTLSGEALVVADPAQGKIDLHLHNGSTHEYQPSDPDNYRLETFSTSDLPIEIGDMSQEARTAAKKPELEKSLRELITTTGPGARDAAVEIQRRFAFPVACIVFALLAVPLAARPRRGGRALGFIVTLLLVCGYYLLTVIGAGLARQGKVPAVAGIWTANIIIAIAGLALLPGMEQIRGSSWFSRIGDWFAETYKNWQERRHNAHQPGRPKPVPDGNRAGTHGAKEAGSGESAKRRVIPLRPVRAAITRTKHRSGFPQMIDIYVLRNFIFYFVLVMTVFTFLFEIFTFFELLDDIARNHASFIVVSNYFLYLIPFLVYKIAPFGVLIGALITIGVMSKNNEVVAIKASGVSLYRLAWPIIGASAILGLGLLTLENTYLPYFNQRQNALRSEIKGKPAQTYLRGRGWIKGTNDKVYNYQIFDPDKSLFGGLNVFELDPATYQLKRRVFASRAQWSPEQNVWMLEGGWVRDFSGDHITSFKQFTVYSLSELNEPPTYFNREVRQSDQMNWRELANYISELRQAGFDVSKLTVQWQEKFAFPMIAPIITLLAIPFAFLVGTRGAVGGIAIGVGIAIVYWAASALSEALGGVGQLPATMAAWSPNAIFTFLGAYFFLKIRT